MAQLLMHRPRFRPTLALGGLLLSSGLVLGGCSSMAGKDAGHPKDHPPPTDERPINTIVVGATTREELLAYAGQPTEIRYTISDDECWVYRYRDLKGIDAYTYRPQANRFKLGDDGPDSVAEFHLLDGVVYGLHCPGDEDNDGVLDYRDQCPHTPEGTKVDRIGCPLPVATGPETLVLDDFEIKGTNFGFDSDKLTAEGRVQVQKVADKLLSKPIQHILITGHTDSYGSDAYNVDLSIRRASTVRDFLVGAGIPKELMSIDGKGESEPIADNATAEGRARNRRVELRVTVSGYKDPKVGLGK